MLGGTTTVPVPPEPNVSVCVPVPIPLGGGPVCVPVGCPGTAGAGSREKVWFGPLESLGILGGGGGGMPGPGGDGL